MLLHADQILDSVLRELSQLQIAAGSTGEGSALQSLGLALKLLAAREPGGAATVHAQLRALAVRLDDIEPHLPPPRKVRMKLKSS